MPPRFPGSRNTRGHGQKVLMRLPNEGGTQRDRRSSRLYNRIATNEICEGKCQDRSRGRDERNHELLTQQP